MKLEEREKWLRGKAVLLLIGVWPTVAETVRIDGLAIKNGEKVMIAILPVESDSQRG